MAAASRGGQRLPGSWRYHAAKIASSVIGGALRALNASWSISGRGKSKHRARKRLAAAADLSVSVIGVTHQLFLLAEIMAARDGWLLRRVARPSASHLADCWPPSTIKIRRLKLALEAGLLEGAYLENRGWRKSKCSTPSKRLTLGWHHRSLAYESQ